MRCASCTVQHRTQQRFNGRQRKRHCNCDEVAGESETAAEKGAVVRGAMHCVWRREHDRVPVKGDASADFAIEGVVVLKAGHDDEGGRRWVVAVRAVC